MFASSQWKRRGVYALIGVIATALLWSFITTPTLEGPIIIEFSWSRSEGFRSIHTVGHVSRLIDPPYSVWLSNPLIVLQSKPLITSILGRANQNEAKGKLAVRVAASVFVLGVDPLNETSHIEYSSALGAALRAAFRGVRSL